MRSADRCKEHYQGDRCKKERHHNSTVHPEPDSRHQGSFSSWTGEGDSKSVVATVVGARTRKGAKRNRQVNRFVRGFGPKATNVSLMPRAFNKTGSALLDLALKYLARLVHGTNVT